MNEISEGKSNKEAVTVQALQNFIPIYTRLHSIRSQWSKMMQ